MTDEQINIAIAEALGWKHEEGESAYSIWNYNVSPSGKRHDCNFGSNRFAGIPDYCHDLNAMHEAEKTLNEKQQVWYLQKLTRVRFNDGVAGMIGCMIDKTTFATARQRAEAFLRVKGLWKEEA